MLFLLNDGVLKVPGQTPDLGAYGLTAEQAAVLPITGAIVAIQRALLKRPLLFSEVPESAPAAAWLLASRGDVNAALFVPTMPLRQLGDVPFRLAKVSSITLGRLLVLQTQGKVTPNVINSMVWLAAA